MFKYLRKSERESSSILGIVGRREKEWRRKCLRKREFYSLVFSPLSNKTTATTTNTPSQYLQHWAAYTFMEHWSQAEWHMMWVPLFTGWPGYANPDHPTGADRQPSGIPTTPGHSHLGDLRTGTGSSMAGQLPSQGKTRQNARTKSKYILLCHIFFHFAYNICDYNGEKKREEKIWN